MRNNFKQMKRGFTLVETLVAISIFSISILGLMSVLASGISGANFAKQKMLASYLAQEGIEYLRNKRDNSMLFGNWSDFENAADDCEIGTECGFNPEDNSAPLFQCAGNNDCKLYINDVGGYNTDPLGDFSGFTRKVWSDSAGLGSGEIKIFSEVSWNVGGTAHRITFSENLFDWY